jgi:hypothetical protein
MMPGPNPASVVSRGEWLGAAAWGLVLAGLAMALVALGYALAPPGWKFNGFIGAYQYDYNSYLAWMRQAYDGHLLFKDLYTTEPHGRVFFHPLFWIMGSLARLTGSGLLALWYVVQVLGSALLAIAVYRFSARFTDDPAVRRLSLVLATTSAGLGWMIGTPRNADFLHAPIDLWLTEANLFQSTVTSFFTLPIALGLMLLALSAALSYIDTGRRRDAVIGGAYGLALAAVHQYDMVTLYAILAVWGLLAGRRRWPGLLLAAVIPLPYCFYSAALVKLDPVLSKVAWNMPVPSLGAILEGWGMPLLLAAAALLAPAVRRGNRRVWWLASWPVVVAALLLLPIAFRRKLLWGATVPLSILAAMGVTAAIRRAVRHWRSETLRKLTAGVVIGAVVVVCAIGSVRLYLFLLGGGLVQDVAYFPTSYFDATAWLEKNSRPEEVALAPYVLAAPLPGRTGLTVFAGHWAQTLDCENKLRFLALFFGERGSITPEQASAVLQRNRVRWVVVETERYEDGGAGDAPFLSLARPAYRNKELTVLEVTAYSPEERNQPWTGGGWNGP